jgi:phosphoribosylformylglycinamidine (FGAM) synthase-like amidotransferase family enzyme
MIIKKSAIKEHSFDYNEAVKFRVRAMPASAVKGNIFFDTGSANWEIFDFVLTGWEGLYNEDESVMTFTKENKKFIFDYVPELKQFIIEKSNSILAETTDTLKN